MRLLQAQAGGTLHIKNLYIIDLLHEKLRVFVALGLREEQIKIQPDNHQHKCS